jgi:hypothetical protein
MNFETFISSQLENDMHETLTEKIGDLVPDRTVNLEELCSHSTRSLQHLYRLMIENTGLELVCVDQMALYFRHLSCGHEYYLPWQNVVDDVGQMIKDKDMIVRCPHHTKEEKKMSKPDNTKKMSLQAKGLALQAKRSDIKQSDLDNAARLQFLFLEPVEKLGKDKRVRAKKLAIRINIRLNAYKAACKEGKMNQVKNAGLALKNGVNYMREEVGVKCAVKLAPKGHNVPKENNAPKGNNNNDNLQSRGCEQPSNLPGGPNTVVI